jgi:hypothetical protein
MKIGLLVTEYLATAMVPCNSLVHLFRSEVICRAGGSAN